jgi:hypothetical protein
VRGDETVCVLRVEFRGLFGDKLDAGKTRTFFKARAELSELLGRADGVGFDATVAPIAYVAGDADALGFGDGEETEPDTLHEAGDEEAGCFFCVFHKL